MLISEQITVGELVKPLRLTEAAFVSLTEHLSLQAHGYRCTTEMVLDMILKASAERSSIEAACQDSVGVTGGNTVRDYLNASLKVVQLREQQAEINAALAASIPRKMKRKEIELVIDLHDEPFYGKRPELLAVTCRGKAKKGSTHFIRVASAYVHLAAGAPDPGPPLRAAR
jgi:hypothetical protein